MALFLETAKMIFGNSTQREPRRMSEGFEKQPGKGTNAHRPQPLNVLAHGALSTRVSFARLNGTFRPPGDLSTSGTASTSFARRHACNESSWEREDKMTRSATSERRVCILQFFQSSPSSPPCPRGHPADPSRSDESTPERRTRHGAVPRGPIAAARRPS